MARKRGVLTVTLGAEVMELRDRLVAVAIKQTPPPPLLCESGHLQASKPFTYWEQDADGKWREWALVGMFGVPRACDDR